MKQTAVEFLEKGMEESGLLLDHKWLVDLIDQAKAMEKNQIIQARTTSPLLASIDKDDYIKEAEQYYNETYEKDELIIAKRFNELAEKYPNYTGFFMRKVSYKINPECKCAGGGYCYAEDKDNNIVRPCTLNETFKSE